LSANTSPVQCSLPKVEKAELERLEKYKSEKVELEKFKFQRVEYEKVELGRTGVNFINILCTAFALVDPKSVKNTVKSSVSFYAFGINERKSCT